MLEDFLRGVLDVNSASPRRYFFEVLQHFAKDELQRERLQHFSTAEGRGDLNLYNQSEGTLLSIQKHRFEPTTLVCVFTLPSPARSTATWPDLYGLQGFMV